MNKITKLKLLGGLVCFGLVTILVGCQSEEELGFETIELTDSPWAKELFQNENPEVFVIADVDDIYEIENFVDRNILVTLQNINCDTHLALAVFRGKMPTNLYFIEVQRIVLREDVITLHVELTDPPLDKEREAGAAAPYHIIKISKDNLFGDYSIELVGEVTIMTMEANIP
jgi:hypothetical protein